MSELAAMRKRFYERALAEAKSLYQPGTDGHVVRYTVREGGTTSSVYAEWPEDENLRRRYCGAEDGDTHAH